MKTRVRNGFERIGFAGVVAAVILFGIVQGMQIRVFQFDILFVVVDILFVDAVVSSAAFVAFMAVSLALFGVRTLSTSVTPLSSGPSFAALVPAYRDPDALSRSVETLRNSDYDDVDIYVICEPDDQETITAAEQLAAGTDVQVLINEQYPGTKAGALNYAVETVDADLFAVFDADTRVDPRFIPSAANALCKEEYDVMHSRLIPEPTGMVESIAYFESVLISTLSQQILYLFTGFRIAATNATAFTRETFDTVGGFDEEMLTEDFAFSHNCYMEHLSVKNTPQPACTIEAAHSLSDWWGQRKRWMIGYMQLLWKRCRSISTTWGRRDIISALIVGGTVIGSIFLLTLVSKLLVLLLLDATLYVVVPIVALTAIVAAVQLYDVVTGTVDRIGLSLLLVPVVLPLFALVTLKSFFEYIFTWDGGWYQVEKYGG